MADQKTKPTRASAESFLNGIADPQQRSDSLRVLELMQEITGKPPVMWGNSIVGFGAFHYVYASGHEGDTFLVGFSPRRNALTLYLYCALQERFAPLVRKLGKVKTGKGCLYVKRLADIDLGVLRELIRTNLGELSATAKRMAAASAGAKTPAKKKGPAKR